MWGQRKAFYNVTRAVLGKRCSWIRPRVLFLHSTVSGCFSKDNRASRMRPGCYFYIVLFLDGFQKTIRFQEWDKDVFGDVACITLLINTSGGCNIALDFQLKMTSCASFFGSGLKLIFHWQAHLFIFSKSQFSSSTVIMDHRKQGRIHQ